MPGISCCIDESVYDEVVKKALAYDGMNLLHCTPKIKNCKEYVTLAVANTGRSLNYAGEKLRADKEMVLRARCSQRPEQEESIYEVPLSQEPEFDETFYDNFAREDSDDYGIYRATVKTGLIPRESNKLDFFEFVW